MSLRICALLESMYGWRGYHTAEQQSPRFYKINPQNFSGRRLYRMCGDANLIVTNSCRLIQQSANHHGKPDVEWVRENLNRAYLNGANLFLICGQIAQQTYDEAQLHFPNVLKIDHPAARRWTNQKLDSLKAQIASYAP